LELAEKGIQRYPDDPHLLDTRGVLLIALNRPDEARKDLERCLELSIGLPRTRASALMNLARLYAQQGAMAQARTRMLDALALDRESGVLSDHDRAEIEQFVSVP
jgi:Flp pilus assembly protein TadD